MTPSGDLAAFSAAMDHTSGGAASPVNEPCPACAASNASSFVYAIGQIEARFPRLAIEKEFIQATARTDSSGKTDREAFRVVLTQPENRYLLRKLCWVLSIDGLDTYLLQPSTVGDLDVLVDTIRARPQPTDLDVVVGVRGPLAAPEMCNGQVIPLLTFDHVYSFDRQSLLASIPRPEGVAEDTFAAATEEVFDRIIQGVDNLGATDDHRALNYLALRYPGIYAIAAEKFGANSWLSAIDVRPSALAGARRLLDVIYVFTHRVTGFTEKYFVRVDVSEEFPFLASRLSPYYDH